MIVLGYVRYSRCDGGMSLRWIVDGFDIESAVAIAASHLQASIGTGNPVASGGQILGYDTPRSGLHDEIAVIGVHTVGRVCICEEQESPVGRNPCGCET